MTTFDERESSFEAKFKPDKELQFKVNARRTKLLGLWAATFILINHLYFVLFEEPGLEQRFGEPYRAYRASVPRWLPRLGGRR